MNACALRSGSGSDRPEASYVRGSGSPCERRISRTPTSLKVTGIPAWTFGLEAIMVALSVHFHYFWLSQPRLARFYQPCKVVTFAIALCLYVYTLGYVVFYL